MLHNNRELNHYTVEASDGPVGKVEDLYFDDEAWVVRYLVVDTGTWLASRRVLVSPMLFSVPDLTVRALDVARTREEIRNAPDIDTARPVSRQQEVDYLACYNTPGYDAGYMPHSGPTHPPPDADSRNPGLWTTDEDPHLRSCKSVTGHHILAIDGDIGHVDGFLIDDHTWAIRYLVVDTSNWWMGHKVLIAPTWVDSVSWPGQSVLTSVTRETIQSAPPYDPTVQTGRAQELALCRHYGREDMMPRSGTGSALKEPA